jgi:hypothetical protein
LSSHLHLHLQSDFFLSGFPPKIVYTFFISSISATCPTHLSLSFNYPSSISVGIQITNFLIMQYSPALYHFIPLRSKCAHHPVARHFQFFLFP